MPNCDTLIQNALVLDGSGEEPHVLDVALDGDRIADLGPSLAHTAKHRIDAQGLALAR